MDVLLVVDMQEGLLRGAPKHDLIAIVERINRLALRVRRAGGVVFLVQHAGPVGDDFEPLTPGWHLLSTINTEPCDRVVSKALNDPFFSTSLQSDLAKHARIACWWPDGPPTFVSTRRSGRPRRSALKWSPSPTATRSATDRLSAQTGLLTSISGCGPTSLRHIR